jgi:hypothetical protein
MPTNVELKASLLDRSRVARRAQQLCGSGAEPIEQEDVLFHGEDARLKLQAQRTWN